MTAPVQPPSEGERTGNTSAREYLTRAEIDLDAIEANVRALRDHVQPALLMAVVKANGYGHGAVMASRAALRGGADWLSVYAPVEGVVLREAGIRAPILVLGPFTARDARALVERNLTPTVTSLQAASVLQDAAGDSQVQVHIKFDTGLNRAGVGWEDAVPFVHALSRFPALRVEGMLTHFASADEADKTVTQQQLNNFRTAAARLAESGISIPLLHTANTGGLLDLPETHLTLARTGIGVYGYYPSDAVSRPVPLHPALRLVSTVTRLHDVPAGTGVGYGFEHRCTRPSRIALAPIGYGDGLPRSLGNGKARVIIRGQFAPIIGRVSMDQVTIDVTDVAGAEVGDEVILIGSGGDIRQTADELAAAGGTISYDILTGLLPRIPRIYREGDNPVGIMSYESGPFVLELPRSLDSADR